MTYIIKCCNCYFDMYLLEINRRPKIMDPERSNVLNIIRMNDMRTEWKSKDDIRKQLFLNFSFFVFHLALKISYAIKCCNCYFDMYLLEINQRPELMDSDKTGYIDIIRIRHRRTECKAKNDLG